MVSPFYPYRRIKKSLKKNVSEEFRPKDISKNRFSLVVAISLVGPLSNRFSLVVAKEYRSQN